MTKILAGKKSTIGKSGVVINDIAPEGKIQYASKICNAMTDEKNFSVGE